MATELKSAAAAGAAAAQTLLVAGRYEVVIAAGEAHSASPIRPLPFSATAAGAEVGDTFAGA
jgi:hypothetical protein